MKVEGAAAFHTIADACVWTIVNSFYVCHISSPPPNKQDLRAVCLTDVQEDPLHFP
jgi:hypothetical protein